MAAENDPDECISKKPWSEVLNRSAKLFAFNLAREGGSSVGRVVFFVILALLALGLVTFVIDSFTGWFSDLFDFWPFGGAEAEAETPKGWFGRDTATAAEPASGTKWYCKWSPLCD